MRLARETIRVDRCATHGKAGANGDAGRAALAVRTVRLETMMACSSGLRINLLAMRLHMITQTSGVREAEVGRRSTRKERRDATRPVTELHAQ